MYDYDFLILQPIEFENLTRDLLQKRERVFIESFTMGRDDGIDLRFAQSRGKSGVIVQAKRYKDYNSLIRVLRSEVKKVRKINPTRYILSTSVALTPENKRTIQDILSPYIQSTEDILGRNDLNNLLGQYKEIEKQYYKLWLGSSSVLESILNKRIENWSTMELEEARKTVSLYVMNDSFSKAEKILKENRYVIISGIPGIGKTTLARMLVYKILGSGYDEFIKINSMDDAAQKLSDGKKQIFMYDDFLGHNFLENKESGFESKVLAFIEKVKREPDKLFILSTREYILSMAKRQYEGFSLNNIELAKCTLDLSAYSVSIRASILYNHLAMAELPTSYISALLHRRQYLNLVKHPNFNPRIIEAFINNKLYLSETPQEFVRHFIDFFDHPLSVWEFAFLKMSLHTQKALIVLASMGDGPVFLSDWYLATEYFLKGGYHDSTFLLEEIEWNDIIKDLLGSFITTRQSSGESIVEFINPSVFDFLIAYIRRYKSIQRAIINHAYFSNQITRTFSDNDFYGLVTVSVDLFNDLSNAFRTHVINPTSCMVETLSTYIRRRSMSLVKFITDMISCFPTLFKSKPSLYSDIVTQELFEGSTYPLYERMALLEEIDVNACHINLDALIDNILPNLLWTHEITYVMNLLERTEKGKAKLKDEAFVDFVESVLDDEIYQAEDEEDCLIMRDYLDILSEHIPGLNADTWNTAIDEVVKQFSTPEPDYDDWESDRVYSGRGASSTDYYDMFSSLLDFNRPS